MARYDPELPTLPRRTVRPLSGEEATTLRLPATQAKGKLLSLLVKKTLIKVPEITVYFWIVKLLTTALGESTSDYLVNHMNPVRAVALGGVGFVCALLLQFVVRRYIAGIYWLAAIMVAIFGTMAADVIHIVLGVPYLYSSLGFAAALAIVFIVWYLTEKTLSIHSINTLRRELFYWATVMATFALGTATGDLTANTFKLGYLTSGVLFLALIAVPAISSVFLRLNEIVAFWWAYILTRPIGASFADWTGKPRSAGGIAIGSGRVSLVLAVLIVALVGYLTLSRRDIQREGDRRGSSAPVDKSTV